MLAFFKGLGIGFLCLVLFVAGVIFNVEFLNKNKTTQTLNFSRSIETSMEAKPDIFHANINFWANENLSTQTFLSNEDKIQISNTFNQILERSKKENFCSSGSFSLEPNFSYKDGVQTPKGQRLHANLECEFTADKLENFNKLLNDLNSIIAKSEFIGISTPALEPKFSKQTLKDNKEKLYSELLKKAYSYEKIYSLDLNKTCILKNLNIESIPNFYPRALNSMKSADNMELSLPIVKDEEQSISGTALIICK
ncbi:SIMPL domain-containing protein [Campylobacter coli]|nr:SIMPL domain-containing protein [Campylobacter coli]